LVLAVPISRQPSSQSSPIKAYNAIHSGEVRAIKIGGQYRIPDTEIDRLQRGLLTTEPGIPVAY
jgi:hypothetical protein